MSALVNAEIQQGYALGRNDASASRPRTRHHRLRTHCCYNLICHSAVTKGAVGIWPSLGHGCHTVAGYSKCCRLSPPHNRHCNRQKWVCVDTIHYKLSVCRGAVVSGRGCDRHSGRVRVCSSSRSPSIERPITVTVTATPCTVLARARCSSIHTKMNHNRCYPHTQPECRDVSSSSCSSQPMGCTTVSDPARSVTSPLLSQMEPVRTTKAPCWVWCASARSAAPAGGVAPTRRWRRTEQLAAPPGGSRHLE